MTVLSPKSVLNLVYLKNRPTVDGVQKTGMVMAARPDQSNLSSKQIAARKSFGDKGRARAAACGIKKGISRTALIEGMKCMKTQ